MSFESDHEARENKLYKILIYEEITPAAESFSGEILSSFTLNFNMLFHSDMLKAAIHGDPDTKEIPLQVSSSNKITLYGLKTCVEFLQHCPPHKMIMPARPIRPFEMIEAWKNTFSQIDSTAMSDTLKREKLNWLVTFAEELHQADTNSFIKMNETIIASMYLGISPLIHLCASKIALVLRSKTNIEAQHMLANLDTYH